MSEKIIPAQLPHKIVASGALFMNEQGQVLLVNPTYKPVWEIPGGVVEAMEPPSEACVREVEEELGLVVAPTRLLGIDYSANPQQGKEVLRFIFWGGVLTQAQIDAIRLPAEELSEFNFFDLPQARELLSPSLGAQVAALVDALPQQECTIYMERPLAG